MTSKLCILMAQIDPTVGGVESNCKKITQIIQENQCEQDLIVFPELALTGYPPEDFLFRTEFHQKTTECLNRIRAFVKDCYVVLGHPILDAQHCYNALSVFHQMKTVAHYCKQKLPNYGVFDEERYFTAGGKNPCILEIKDQRIGLCICEDLWQPGPVGDLVHEGISILTVINSSPFDANKYEHRKALAKLPAEQGIALLYVNQTGGQDELVFDGQSFAVDKTGRLCAQAPAFEEQLTTVVFHGNEVRAPITPPLKEEALLYKALVCGTRDYVFKNHFPGVVLGLSGGIDSALTLCIATDALGADKVHALIMPSRFSAAMSQEDAINQAKAMGVTYSVLSIEPVFELFLNTLAPVVQGLPEDSTEENIQARIRGTLLMAYSNKMGAMLLSTSNKSETAVGYTTLYGDMAGGYAPLKDVLKTQVYALAQYRNAVDPVIPQRAILRAPSAELKANQTDQDSLPDYAVLDRIIQGYMVNTLSPEELIQQGLAPDVVHRVIQLIKQNEYKRRQAPPGIKISPVAFGRDWRYPLCHDFY